MLFFECVEIAHLASFGSFPFLQFFSVLLLFQHVSALNPFTISDSSNKIKSATFQASWCFGRLRVRAAHITLELARSQSLQLAPANCESSSAASSNIRMNQKKT